MTNSGDSPRSDRRKRIGEITLVVISLSLLASAFAFWVFKHGYVLWWGDAQAHLNNSRAIIDSRTPGYDQLGTVWLPLLQLLCLPLVTNDWLWSSGLAGAIPVAACFVIAGTCFYLAARDVYGDLVSAVAVLGCFVLNPNVLYLASIPMTEIVFLAGLSVLILSLLRFRHTQQRRFLVAGVAASWWMSLTRYDGWFLIPFAAFAFALFAGQRRLLILILFGSMAGLAPGYWLAHNWWETSNPLDFYNGPYSAIAIQGPQSYPGYHDWHTAIRYYAEAGKLCAGWPLILLGTFGLLCLVVKRKAFPVAFLFLTPVFYIWSMHSSGNPIFLPTFWKGSYYNTRYGIAVVPLAAFAAGAIVFALPQKAKRLGLVLPLLCLAPWLAHASKDDWICWKESQVNSVSRRAWTGAGAKFLLAHYRLGQGILAGFGDVPGIFCQAGIHLQETLNIGNGPEWSATTTRPDLVHRELWAVAREGDFLWQALKDSKVYVPVEEIRADKAPTLIIYRRTR